MGSMKFRKGSGWVLGVFFVSVFAYLLFPGVRGIVQMAFYTGQLFCLILLCGIAVVLAAWRVFAYRRHVSFSFMSVVVPAVLFIFGIFVAVTNNDPGGYLVSIIALILYLVIRWD